MEVLNEVLNTVAPVLVETATVLLVSVLSWAVYRFTGVHLDEKAKQGIHDAMDRAAQQVMLESSAASKEAKVNKVVSYVTETNPGDIARLKASTDTLKKVAATKL